MKTIYSFMLAMLFAVPLFAQVPGKMSYQAIVRDNNNSLITNSMIGLHISILHNTEVIYEETQTPVTNANGLISIEIGGSDGFKTIKWANGPYFIKTEIDPTGGENYTVTGVSQMLSVPYALHALSASYITGNENTILKDGIPSQTWSLFGNTNSDPDKDKLGTSDAADLVIVTNDIERMRIYSNGNIDMTSALKVGGTLNVDGATDLNGSLDVNNASPTNLSGTLNVDGATDLNSSLDVNNASATNLTGTLNVDGATDLNSSLDVNNASATNLTGTLNVDGATDLNSSLDVNNASATNLTGTLNVDGATDLNSSLDVNNASATNLTGTLNVDGATDLNNSLDVNNESPTHLTGALDVDLTLNVDGATSLNSSLEVTKASSTHLTGTLNVDGATDLNSSLDVNNASPANLTGTLNVVGATDLNSSLDVNNASPSHLTGALDVDLSLNVDGATDLNSSLDVNNQSPAHLTGTLDVDRTLNVDGATELNNTLNVDGATTINNTTGLNGQVTINANVAGGEASYGAYPLRVQGSDQGIAIKLTAGTPHNENNFITFFNSAGGAVGRIEGETAAEKALTPEFLFEESMLIAEEVKAGLSLIAAAIPIPVVLVVGECLPCLAMAALDLALATANLVAFNIFELTNMGVTYQSGSADYAEWLERYDPNEIISAGDIVGVYNGKISKYTLNAQQYLVISTKPAILGNMPMAGKEDLYEKVAFMGQIPVKVRGVVLSGDYILPSGLNDGTGVAVSPENIKAEQYREIVGVAWSIGLNMDGISMINMAIGLNTNDVADLAIQQEKKIRDLENQFNLLEERLLALENGTGYTPNKVAADKTQVEMQTAPKKMTRAEMIAKMPAELSDELMEEAFRNLENVYRDRGINYKNHPGLNKLFTDPAFKAEIIRKAQENYKISYQSILNATQN